MIDLGFRRDLYSGFAIDAAVKAFAGIATCEMSETEENYQVRLTGSGAHDETRIADEFRNYALGATIEEAQSRQAPSGD